MKKALHMGLILISILLFAGIFFLSVIGKEDESEVAEEDVAKSTKELVVAVANEDEKIDLEEAKEQKNKTDKKALKEKDAKKDVKKESTPKENEKTKAPKEKKGDKSSEKTTQEEQTKVKKEAPKNKKEYTEEKHSGAYYVTSQSLNYRTGAGTDYKVVGNLKSGQEVQVTKETSNGWYGFESNGKVVYSSANLLSKDKPKEEKPKENKAKEEKPAKDNAHTNKTVADQLTGIGGNNQLILVTTKGYSTSHAKIRTFERKSDGNWKELMNESGFIGKNGFADNKKEGDGKSPTGKYSVGHGFGYEGNPGTNISFKNSTSNDVWVDDTQSKFYNSWQTKNNEKKIGIVLKK